MVLLSCQREEFNVDKPSLVPASAQLIGGVDGWEWVDCKPTSPIHLECKIYDQLGALSHTSFFRPCFNIRVKDNGPPVASRLNETLIYFKEINLYEYKPSVFEDELAHSDIAMKYYEMLGVDDNCSISSQHSELVLVSGL